MLPRPWFLCAMLSLIGYFLGSIFNAELIVRHVKHEDVRAYGDGNPGAYNTGKACGVGYGILCGSLDIAKAALPVFIAARWCALSGWLLVPVCLAPHLGHRFPPGRPAAGGKGITTAFGALIGLIPEAWLALIWAVCILVLLPFQSEHARLMALSVALFWVAAPFFAPPLPLLAAGYALSGSVAVQFIREIKRERQSEHEDTLCGE